MYRRQFLQENIRWKALDEIYNIYMFLHRSDLNISASLCQFFRIFGKMFFNVIFQHCSSNFAPISRIVSRNFAESQCKESVSEDKKGKEYPCIERKVVHSVMKAKLQHSFDGHRARDTSNFSPYILSAAFQFFAIFSSHVSIFTSRFSNRSSSRIPGLLMTDCNIPVIGAKEFRKFAEILENLPKN